jgi:hypothetical protein
VIKNGRINYHGSFDDNFNNNNGIISTEGKLMVDIDSLKLYYYNTGTSSWVQVTSITQFPMISKKMDSYSVCTVTLHDFEGASFATWYSRDNTYMKIEDDFSHVLFQGYLKEKTFSKQGLVLTIHGFASKLDEIPFNHNYILESGLVKSVAFDAFSPPLAIAATNAPVALCYMGGYYYVLSNADEKVYKYNLDFTYTGTSYDISGDVTNPTGICWNGEYFFVVSQNDDKVYVYNTAFALQTSVDVSQGALIHPMGICWDGLFIYIGHTDEVVYQYDSDLVYTDTSFDVSGDVETISGFCFAGESFYIVDHNVETVFQFDLNFDVVDSFDISATNDVYGIGWDGSYFILIDAVGEQCYLYLSDFTAYSDNNVVELKQDDEDAGYPDFEWDDRYWVYNRDVGLLIQDNTQGVQLFTWDNDSLTPHDHDFTLGVVANLNTPYEEGYYIVEDGNVSYIFDAYVDLDVIAGGGESISDAYQLKKIAISYRFGPSLFNLTSGESNLTIYLQIYNGTSWITIRSSYLHWATLFLSGIAWVEQGIQDDPYEILSSLEDYLDKTGANYTSLKGIRFKMVGTCTGLYDLGRINIDYLNVKIYYSADQISPVMDKIDDNSASWLMCSGQDFSSNGVQAEDKFQIGENTTQILRDIISTASLSHVLNSTLTKYMARRFKGGNCMDALQSICQLEGLHWTEDHLNGVIIVAKEANFEDSGIALTSTDYEDDWSYEDNVNHYRGIWVHGNASLGIEYKIEDVASTSFKWKQVIDDTIMTVPDAKSVADELWSELATKRPSLKLTVTDDDGGFSALDAMKTVDITLERPTVASADYPMRRIDISRVGEHLKYTIYAGLGSTPEAEKQTNLFRQLGAMAHKQYTDRLINTPLGAGANLTPDDIAGLDTYILSLLSTNAAVSIEWLDEDPAAYHITQADLTMDGTWNHTLDLDDFITVPEGSILAIARIAIKDASTQQALYVRPHGFSNIAAVNGLATLVANAYNLGLLFIPLDADNIFDYYSSAGIDVIGITILGFAEVVA